MGKGPSKKSIDVAHVLEGIEGYNKEGGYSKETAQSIVVKCLTEGCDITTACGLAKISRTTYAKWMKNDKLFSVEAIYARETAVRELLLKCKADTSQAFKLLKNVAKGRYMDDPNQGNADKGSTVQILFNIPRPAHVLAKGESVKVIGDGKDTE